MDFYVKDDNGLRKATQDEILSMDTQLFDAEGNALNRPQVRDEDPIKELTELVHDIAKTVEEKVEGSKTVEEKVEELETQLAAYKEASKKGFPIPDVPDGHEKEVEEIEKVVPYDMARQGKRLQDKLLHPTHVIDEDTRKEMARYFTLVVRAGMFQDNNARQKMNEIYGVIRPETRTAIGDSGNAFPIPDIVDSEVLAFAREKSVVLQYARIWDMVSEKMSFPTEGTAVSVGWGNTTSESEPDVNSETELDATELSAYAVVRNMTLADARTDIVSWLTEAMAEAAGMEIDNEAFNGDGTDVCSGILSAACGYSVVMGSGLTNFSSLTATHLSQLIAKLDGMRKEGARFYMHGSVLHYVRDLKDSNNRPIFVDTIGSPLSGTIFGYPYSEVIKCPSTSGANTAFIAFGNLRYFAVGRRLDASALEVDPYGLFTTNRTRFKLYQRWGMKIALANGFARLLTAAS